MKTWNLGIVGAGMIAEFHAQAINDIPNAKLVAVCDKVAERADNLASKYSCKAFTSYEEMYTKADVDIITIATPSGLHMNPTIAAAKAGKHVICEKPLEIKLERIDAMIEAHKKAGTHLGAIFPLRYTNAVRPLKQAIDDGRFGKISYVGVYVPWWRSDEYYQNTWHGTLKLDGGGALMNQSIHLIDMLCYLMPPVESVQAFMGTIAHSHIEAEDTVVAVLRLINGALGVIYGTTASYPGQPLRFEVSGSGGTVVYVGDSFTVWQFADETPQDEQIRKEFGGLKTKGGISDPAAIDYIEHHRNFEAFIEALEKGHEFELSGRQGRKAVELILAVYKASKGQKLIKLKNL